MKNRFSQWRAARKEARANHRSYMAIASIDDPRVRAEIQAAMNR